MFERVQCLHPKLQGMMYDCLRWRNQKSALNVRSKSLELCRIGEFSKLQYETLAPISAAETRLDQHQVEMQSIQQANDVAMVFAHTLCSANARAASDAPECGSAPHRHPSKHWSTEVSG
jgi:hypothetical protein